jgi:exopolyphosphatase / guanosine-5'-triphosphate,3'-diphosphate pyrophosphatase
MAGQGMPGEGDAVAAVDLGSNSLKLTVARRVGDAVEEIDWDLETVRLGRGLDDTGRLADDRVEAALAAMRRFAERAQRHGAVRRIGVATEAVRAAANGSEFLRRVRDETGFDVAVIEGAREAALTFAGLDPSVVDRGTVVVADIGGASTEVIVAADGVVERSRSLPIGSGRYTDRFVVADPPAAAELVAARAAAAAAIAAEPVLADLPAGPGVRLVLVGGTGEYLGVLAEAAGGLSAAGIDRVLDHLRGESADALAARLAIVEARARVLPAGAAIAAGLADLTRPEAVATARSGIRRGLLLEAFGLLRARGEPPLGT